MRSTGHSERMTFGGRTFGCDEFVVDMTADPAEAERAEGHCSECQALLLPGGVCPMCRVRAVDGLLDMERELRGS